MQLRIALLALLFSRALLAADCSDKDVPGDPALDVDPQRIVVDPIGVIVRVPAGDFCMGDHAGNGEADEQPVHAVDLGAFWLSRYEVTREQFRQFIIATGYVSDAERETSAQAGCLAVDPNEWSFKYRPGLYWDNPGYEQADMHPVVCVSFNDVLAFISWLNRLTGQTFRLPTEAEWEYTARAGSRTIYPWGDSSAASCRYANVADDNAWPGYTESPFGRIGCDDGHAFTAPVGSYAANLLGLYDLSGNVWEWTGDCWAKSYAFSGPGARCALRSFRGSSWMNSAKSLRSANRSKNGPSDRLNTVGFRLALDYDPASLEAKDPVDESTNYRE